MHANMHIYSHYASVRDERISGNVSLFLILVFLAALPSIMYRAFALHAFVVSPLSDYLTILTQTQINRESVL